MIKALIFDLDGVLVSTKMVHFDALNRALAETSPNLQISFEEHLKVYDGISTMAKLKKLSNERGLDSKLHEKIWERKQEITEELYLKYKAKDELAKTFAKLCGNYKIVVATNSIRQTTVSILQKIGIFNYIHEILTNNDVKHIKPHSEIYLKAMVAVGCNPKECLIFEDSPSGLRAAIESGANVYTVNNIDEINYDNIMKNINFLNQKTSSTPYMDNNLTVLIPMAGRGSRFEQAGYSFPKPMIDIKGKTMIHSVVESLNIKANYIYLVQKSHNEKYNLKMLLELITPGCRVIEVDGITEGSACTTLLAKEFIDNDKPLLFANSDQIVEWNSSEFIYKMNNKGVDGGILTFENSHPKWSYADVDEFGFVSRVAEKVPISKHATVGIYWYKRGSDYVRFTEQMIKKNIRVNNEFYICPVFNEFIEAGKKILIHEINAKQMHGTGTPEDLDDYLQYLNENNKP